MLSERERRTLAGIEQHLVESDPELARLFTSGRPRRTGTAMPTFLLVAGVSLMLLGSMLVTASIAIVGVVFAVVALGLAYFRATGRVWPATA
jgi:hypothetical protein